MKRIGTMRYGGNVSAQKSSAQQTRVGEIRKGQTKTGLVLIEPKKGEAHLISVCPCQEKAQIERTTTVPVRIRPWFQLISKGDKRNDKPSRKPIQTSD